MTQLREDARAWFGIKELENGLAAVRKGTGVPKSVGSGGGQGANGSSAAVPDGEDVQKETGPNEDLKKPLQVGDEPEKFELKDCETNEPVTLDGIGGNGSEATPPAGFEDCKNPDDDDPSFVPGKIWRTYAKQTVQPINLVFFQTRGEGVAYISGTVPRPSTAGVTQEYWDDTLVGGSGNAGLSYAESGIGYEFGLSHVTCDSVSSIPAAVVACALPPPKKDWPINDKNHLNWDKEKGCIEPLCPEFNTQVSAKFQNCEDEYILCDKDGKKVHVKVNADGTMDVTQEQFGQTAKIRDGRVVDVKNLAETQMDRLFRD